MPTDKLRLPSYGGQALIEGVLMRGAKFVAGAFRLPNGEIEIETEELSKIYQSKMTKIPFLRGLVILWDSLGLGTRFLTLSANKQGEEDEKLEGSQLALTLIISLAMAIGLFFVGPALVGQGLEALLKFPVGWGNIIEGVVRLIVVVGYIWGIGKMPDIHRVFAYHGAEHKTINAFEAGEVLTPENVAKYSLEHPRCGTSFLLTLVVLSVLVFSAIGKLPILWTVISRILLLPPLAMLGYEYIRWTANHLDSAFVRWLIKPNMALQRLTTNEPSLDILEVAIAAFNAMYALEHPGIIPLHPAETAVAEHAAST
ncbi:predicted metal-dependent enzyme [Longilinea arvoryzae]|uniref:Predicted metal-dependent enzyme n=1 Tax=Longilinea arvoryzae TaxID=360412 RepID=A0A0S7BGN7_9CHLR|nr:DUF1385 domain-containing protein [Longilinea arvoryzae]GAP14713.1 predicted metal-dependent enzyme [Longilinea arvoryzae]